MSTRVVRVTALAVLLCLGAATVGLADDHTPKPYDPDEFAAWMRDLWRAEAVFVGAFPFAIFVTFEVYDTIRYAEDGFRDPSYAPWPLGSGSSTYSTTESTWLAVSALSLSLIVAGIDFLIGRINESSPKN